MKKILGSPLGSRKKAATQQQYFGVPLEGLLRREDATIPHLVCKICDYVLRNGASSTYNIASKFMRILVGIYVLEAHIPFRNSCV